MEENKELFELKEEAVCFSSVGESGSPRKSMNFATINSGSLAGYTGLSVSSEEDSINSLLEEPEGNLEEIRKISDATYRKKGVYFSVIQFLKNLPTLDYTLVPRFAFSEEKADLIMKHYQKVENYCEDILDKPNIRRILQAVLKDGCFFGVERSDGKKNYYIQRLPNQYCRSGIIIKGLPSTEFDFSFFDDRLDDTVFDLYPPEFKTLYNAYGGDTYLRWQMLDIDTSMCFLFDMDEVPLPVFTGALNSLAQIDGFYSNLKKSADNDTFMLLNQELPFDKEQGKVKVSRQIATTYHKNFSSLLPDGVNGITSPFPINSIKTTQSKADREMGIDKANKRVNDDLGVTPALFSEATNVSGIKANIEINANMVFSIIEKIETWMRKRLEMETPKSYRFKVKFLPTTNINRSELFALHEKLLNIGGSISPLFSIAGIDPDSYVGLLEMEKLLGIKDKLQIPQSVHTANTTDSDTAGRPADENSETGEEAKDKGTNEEARDQL